MKKQFKLVLFFVFLGVILWFLDASIDYFYFQKKTFIEVLITGINTHEIYMRTIQTVVIFLVGIITAIIYGNHIKTKSQYKENEKYSNSLLNSVNDMIWTAEIGGKMLYINDAVERVYGIPAKNFYNKEAFWLEYIDPRDKDQVRKESQQLLEKGNVSSEYRIILPNGDIRWLSDRKTVVRDTNGFPIHIGGIASDITELIRMKEELKAERDRANQYLQVAGVIFVALDRNGEITLINRKGCEVLGYPEAEIIGKNWFDHFLPDDLKVDVKRVFSQLMSGAIEQVEYYDNPVVNSAGEKRIIDWHNSVLTDDEGNITGILSSGEDITERKKADDKIRAALREKEVLLREVHHRVKNNLQVVSSLLSLQADKIEDPNMLAIFGESRKRIKTMAMVHENLYRSDNLADIDMNQYIRNLADEVFRFYCIDDNCIRLNIKAETIRLDISIAIPCGLIINELISNALTHAFLDGRTGQVNVLFHRYGTNQIQLVVSDNGVGIEKNIDLESPNGKGLGMRLVHLLAKDQLEGTLDIERSGGTTFTITLKIRKND